ncbi:YceI family protein [Alteromonadaceae bacterium BrNp21-10]|nr:YceI family protein [Alteromonadaceae bacterium BrNp21-10]
MRISSLVLSTALLCSTNAFADWQLANDQSTLNFISTKNAKVTELHKLKSMSGAIDDAGNAIVKLDLSSVDTGIEIRDQRMLAHLFDVARFANATVTLKVPQSALTLKVGQQQSLTLDFNVDLHGVNQVLPIAVVVTALEGGNLHVQSTKPVILSSQAFGLDAGIEMLRSLAKLDNIVTSVPVTFALTFVAKS